MLQSHSFSFTSIATPPQSPLSGFLNFGEPQLLILALLLFVYMHFFSDLFQPNAIIYMLMTSKCMTLALISTMNSTHVYPSVFPHTYLINMTNLTGSKLK